MSSDELAAGAGIAAAMFAAFALVFTGFQMRQATRSRDFETLTGISERMRSLEDQLLAAVGDDVRISSLTVQLLNWVELLAVGVNKKLLESASKEFAHDLVIEILAIVDASNMAGHLDGKLTGEAYKHTVRFMRDNEGQIKGRVALIIEQEALSRPEN